MIKAKLIIEIMGSPKEFVEKILNEILEKIKKEQDVKILTEQVADVEQLKDGFWSNFSELEISVDNVERLMNICFDYRPSSIEILEPEKTELGMDYLTGLLNDLLAQLHKYDMLIRNITAENMILKKKLGVEDKK